MFLLSLLGAHSNIISIDIIACLSKEEEKHSFIKVLSLKLLIETDISINPLSKI